MTETYYPVIGGGETQARALAQDCTARGHKVTVLARRSDTAFSKFEMLDGVQIYRLWPSGPGHLKKWLMLMSSFWWLVRNSTSYEVVLVSGYRVLGISAVIATRLARKRCVLKADNNGEMSGDYFAGGLRHLGLEWATGVIRLCILARNWLLRRADLFVAISTDISQEMIAHDVARNRIVTIPNSYDPSRFYPLAGGNTKQALRARFSLPLDATLVIFTGRLLASKGLPLLIRVWEKLSLVTPAAKLVIVGAGTGLMGSCEDEIRHYVSEKRLTDQVIFTGSVRNVEDYLQCSDVFVFPTENEAFGISLIEAMACGLAPVATMVGGIKDIVAHGKTGLLIPPLEFEPLYDALKLVIENEALRKEISHGAALAVRQRYSRDRIAGMYSGLFQALVAGESGHIV